MAAVSGGDRELPEIGTLSLLDSNLMELIFVKLGIVGAARVACTCRRARQEVQRVLTDADLRIELAKATSKSPVGLDRLLLRFVWRDKHEMVAFLLLPEVGTTEDDRGGALRSAAAEGRAAMVVQLLAAGTSTGDREWALDSAVENDDDDMIALLLTGFKYDGPDDILGMLQQFVRLDKHEIVALLLLPEVGTTEEQRDKALSDGAESGNATIVGKLLAAGTSVMGRGMAYLTAVARGHTDVAGVLRATPGMDEWLDVPSHTKNIRKLEIRLRLSGLRWKSGLRR